MIIKYLAFILLALCIVSCKKDSSSSQAASGTSEQNENPTKAIQNCFDSYRSAILDQDGETAVKFLSNSTIQEYQRYVDWALGAKEEELKEMSFINRMQIIILRHRVDVNTLKTLDGRSAIIYAVDRDWIGKNGVIQTSLGAIDVMDSRATAEIMIGDER